MRVVVIGGGMGGLAAARRLAAGGARVTVLEASRTLGGLVEDFEVAGTSLEQYYHYLIPGEPDILELLDELRLGQLVEWFPSTIGVLVEGRVWSFTTPVDLLRFRPLPLVDRLRAGIGALRLGSIRDWRELDVVTAREWLTSLTSQAVTDVVWDPLLRAKFGSAADTVPAAWMWGRLQQRRGARRRTGEELGYLVGGFQVLVDALAGSLRAAGVDIRTGTRAARLVVEDGRVAGVEAGEGVIPADRVLFTGALPRLAPLVPDEAVDARWTSAEGLGCAVVILELSRPLTREFWTNVCDRAIPFGGIIEHTNLVPTSWYGGRHVVYLSRYFTAGERVGTQDLDELADEWLGACEHLFDGFDRDQVLGRHCFRTPYAAPLVTTPYLPRIPPAEADLPGLWLATTAQIYPQDRGMSEAIKRGQQVAAAMLGTGWACPVCGSRDGRPAWPAPTTGSEGGVDPASFRPSADVYGRTVLGVLECAACSHACLADAPDPGAVDDAYAGAVDEVSRREVPGLLATAAAALERIERHRRPGRLLDIGCWTGTFLLAARQRGWDVEGVEPSRWAAAEARAAGIPVQETTFDAADLQGPFDAVVATDVLEHLVDPGAVVRAVADLLAPDGVLYVTVPDAGSRLARALGRRWWSVLPMHFQYFTRRSLTLLLARNGFEVVEIDSHAKRFSLRYYAERAGGFLPGAGRLRALAGRLPGSNRLVAPDFRDRVQVVARRRCPPASTS